VGADRWCANDDAAADAAPSADLRKHSIARSTACWTRLALGWRADCEIGLKLPEDRKYNPEPDVTVIDRDSGLDQIYAERFYFVAEVLSEANRPEHRDGSDQPQVLAVKLAWYKKHPHCRGVLFLEQRRVEGELHLRGKRWQKQQLTAPADRIVIPDIGDIGSLGALYRDTPLYPGEAAL